MLGAPLFTGLYNCYIIVGRETKRTSNNKVQRFVNSPSLKGNSREGLETELDIARPLLQQGLISKAALREIEATEATTEKYEFQRRNFGDRRDIPVALRRMSFEPR